MYFMRFLCWRWLAKLLQRGRNYGMGLGSNPSKLRFRADCGAFWYFFFKIYSPPRPRFWYFIYTILPPIRPHCGEAPPGPRFEPGTGDLEAGTLTWRCGGLVLIFAREHACPRLNLLGKQGSLCVIVHRESNFPCRKFVFVPLICKVGWADFLFQSPYSGVWFMLD